MIQIIRTEDSEYQLQANDGTVIKTYDQQKMNHPRDWIDDAKDVGYTVSGPYDWEFVDDRDIVTDS